MKSSIVPLFLTRNIGTLDGTKNWKRPTSRSCWSPSHTFYYSGKHHEWLGKRTEKLVGRRKFQRCSHFSQGCVLSGLHNKLSPVLTEYDRESDEYVAPFPFRPVPGFFSILYIPIEETGIAGITCLIPEFSCQGSTERQHQTLLSILSLSLWIRFTALKAYRMDRN